jgi:hypothetical protein
MADTRLPIFRAGLADSIGIFLSWAVVGLMGSLYIRNRGPDVVFMAFDALPAAATVGDGRFGMQLNEAVNLDDVRFTVIGLLCAAAQTGTVEAIGIIRPGSSGAGIS